MAQPTKGAGTLRRAVRSQAFAWILGGRHMECAYYFDFKNRHAPLDGSVFSSVAQLFRIRINRNDNRSVREDHAWS
jgi:hypothetical protein